MPSVATGSSHSVHRAVEASDGAGMVGGSAQLEGLALRVRTVAGPTAGSRLVSCTHAAQRPGPAAGADPKLRQGKVGRGQGGTQVSAKANTCGSKTGDVCRGSSATMCTWFLR